MPELGEQMYCSQQICIPPTFPYLLRQFAKAAIRTQPNDILKWATAYFRCLSLNIPPPVKPRLEYPIPRDHHGLTPGWLRALLYQLHGNETVGFKILWDRWIGACLQHPNLIQILCLGAFTDNTAVPWLKFIALCAGHLTENLTQTMILICEILTEEPEGGSAMIPVDIFIMLYEFLARIEASIPQTLKNYYFLDKFLELYEEKIKRDMGPKIVEEITPEETISTISSVASEVVIERVKKDEGSVISCPSVPSQDDDNFMAMLQKVQDAEMEEEYDDALIDQKPVESEEPIQEDSFEKIEEPVVNEEEVIEKDEATEVAEEESDTTESKDDLSPYDQCLETKFEQLRQMHLEITGESEIDLDMEHLKATLLGPYEFTDSKEVSKHYKTKVEKVLIRKEKDVVVVEEPMEEKQVEPEYEEVFVDAIPGIGPVVPEEIISVVKEYMNNIAKTQHDMVMPRNIRHFNCPPLQVYID